MGLGLEALKFFWIWGFFRVQVSGRGFMVWGFRVFRGVSLLVSGVEPSRSFAHSILVFWWLISVGPTP